MVAPSFVTYKVLTETPFLKNGKLYITVEHPNTHNSRDVRWYSQEEYNKAYGKKDKNSSFGKYRENGLQTARGFKDGPILLIRNDSPKDKQWLEDSVARYAVDFGWYIASTDRLPADAPSNFKYLLLSWNEIRDPSDPTNNTQLPRQQITSIIAQKVKNKEYITFPA